MPLPSPLTASPDLDPAVLEPLLDMIMETSPAPANETGQARAARRTMARLAILALRPTDQFQAMLAAQTVVAHFAIMDAYRRAAPLDVPDKIAARLRNNAVSLTRTMHATLRRLREQQALAPTKPANRPVAAAAGTTADRPVLQLPQTTQPERRAALGEHQSAAAAIASITQRLAGSMMTAAVAS